MSSYPPILDEDDLTPNHHARRAYTASDYEILGLNPSVDLQAYVFPPFRPVPVETAASLLLTPILESSSYPISGRLYSASGHFNRSMCDLYTVSYEPKLTVWTPDGEVPDMDGAWHGVITLMNNLARSFPQYARLISTANSHDLGSAKKVRDVIMRYIKEERDKSWNSTTVNPCGLIWQAPALEGPDDVQGKNNSAFRTQSHTFLDSTGRDRDVKYIGRKQRSSKRSVSLRLKKRVQP